ncbi:hypothetical protein PQO03_12940 [Lentisphaera profundi]|uniref:Uncharacterized protein n=1 Tax=Lentisphaera profundi TaxID=1658616 RepID=A0ABY7W0U5_9BACT|nr:hypothetical protein [Lentisphaera profundi]WDE98742.1 hypothetical protein PQO03_12940 [Lentisphaera profundi]
MIQPFFCASKESYFFAQHSLVQSAAHALSADFSQQALAQSLPHDELQLAIIAVRPSIEIAMSDDDRKIFILTSYCFGGSPIVLD